METEHINCERVLKLIKKFDPTELERYHIDVCSYCNYVYSVLVETNGYWKEAECQKL